MITALRPTARRLLNIPPGHTSDFPMEAWMSTLSRTVGGALMIALLQTTGCGPGEVGPGEEEAEGVNPDDPVPWGVMPAGVDDEEELGRWIASGCKLVSGFANGDHTQ